MDLKVPDEFVNMLKEIDKEIWPERVVSCLEWASKNPEKARDAASQYGRLSRHGRSEFATHMLYSADPERALQFAEERDAEYRKRCGLFARIKAAAANGREYRAELPNGVPCIIRKDENGYRFDFTVGGSTISMRVRERGLWRFLKPFVSGPPLIYGEVVELRHGGNKVVGSRTVYYKAVERNMRPELVALMDGTTSV